MAGKLKTVQPEYVMRQTLTDGIEEMRRSGVVVKVGNTAMNGGAMVIAISAWRYCSSCGEVVTTAQFVPELGLCQECAGADVPVLAQREAVPK